MQIYVEGKIRSRVREDKEGYRRRVVEIIADNFEILTRQYNTSIGSSETENPNSDQVYEEIIADTFSNLENKSNSNLSKLLSEDTEIEKLGDLPF